MQDIKLKLRVATEDDLAEIARLATEIWNDHYVPIIGKAQVDYMLHRMYSIESLRDQLLVKKHQFFLVITDQTVRGFVSVNEEKNQEWFLNKFYLQQNQSAKGLGTAVFSELKEILNPTKITLTVNRQNYKSINFYFKNGFTIQRVADFDIGDGYVMNDFVMVWEK
jgi:ribosomal protein S18 acetylase RimI-like enzyme